MFSSLRVKVPAQPDGGEGLEMMQGLPPRPQERKFLGFSFTKGPEVKRAIAPKALERFKERVREITRRAKGVSIEATMAELVPYLRGWRGYFGFCETPEVLLGLIRWVRLRLRAGACTKVCVNVSPRY